MGSMENFVVILLSILVFRVHASFVTDEKNLFLRIDCGVKGEESEVFNGETWYPDSYLTDSGKTKQIMNPSIDHEFMTTLRYFPKGDKNCYTLPLDKDYRYIFRAGFYYGNYDGKSQPPVFDLLLGGQLWETVNTSVSDGPIFHELIYHPQNDDIDVCLVAKENGGIPFISSLEATYLQWFDLNEKVYEMTKNKTAYHLVSRLNFGSYDKVVEPGFNSDCPCYEDLNRYWKPQKMPGYTNLSCVDNTVPSVSNSPPYCVISTAIVPINPSESIYIPINFTNDTPQASYIVLYFYQPVNYTKNNNDTRNMDIYVDGVIKENLILDELVNSKVVTLYPVLVQGTVNITISRVNSSSLPPLLNGLELFVATEISEEISDGFKVLSSSLVVLIFQVLCFFLFVFV